MTGVLICPWLGLGQPQQHPPVHLQRENSMHSHCQARAVQLLTCSAMALWWRAWPAAGAARMPGPHSQQPRPMLSSAGLPRTACREPCLANDTKPDAICRGMQPSLHALQGQEHSLDDAAAACAALCRLMMHRHADVQLPAHCCPGSPVVELAHSWGAFRGMKHWAAGTSSASG